MNNSIKKINLSKTDIIKASEIGQYYFCSISWKLYKSGYKPNSNDLKKGKQIHNTQGILIENINKISRNSKILKLIGYSIFLIALFIIFFEVIF